MQKSFLIALLIIAGGAVVAGAFLLTLNGGANNIGRDVTRADFVAGNFRQVNLEIRNMFCVGCEMRIAASLMSLPGVAQADANLRTGSGWVIYNPEEITIEEILAASIFQRYPARVVSDQLLKNVES